MTEPAKSLDAEDDMPADLVTIDGYRLELTSSAAPEQYDVFDGATQIGWLKLRNGTFRATASESDVVVMKSRPKGNARFHRDERQDHLRLAVQRLKRFRQCAPDVGAQNKNELAPNSGATESHEALAETLRSQALRTTDDETSRSLLLAAHELEKMDQRIFSLEFVLRTINTSTKVEV